MSDVLLTHENTETFLASMELPLSAVEIVPIFLQLKSEYVYTKKQPEDKYSDDSFDYENRIAIAYECAAGIEYWFLLSKRDPSVGCHSFKVSDKYLETEKSKKLKKIGIKLEEFCNDNANHRIDWYSYAIVRCLAKQKNLDYVTNYKIEIVPGNNDCHQCNHSGYKETVKVTASGIRLKD